MKSRLQWTRREMVQSMGATAASAALPWFRISSRQTGASPDGRVLAPQATVDPAILIDGTAVRALAMRALDAAKAAGAEYADVRLTRQLTQNIISATWLGSPNEQLGIGVRVRIQGGWGFAGSPYWNADEAVQLARTAAVQANANANGAASPSIWAPIPVALGAWATPIKVDPFVLSVEEKMDRLQAWMDLGGRYRGCEAKASANFIREERAVATTEGAYFTQTLYQSGGGYGISRSTTTRGEQLEGGANAAGLATTAAGWEIFDEADIPGQLPALYDAADPHIPGPTIKRGDVGRYDVVFDAATMGALMEKTIGTAAQVDRALGYEANASGTSYLGPDPLALLGTYKVASPLVTITANRSMPRGVGTVKWDDEGVEPDDFTLVKDGVLMDYQTTRDQAEWLRPWYEKHGTPVHSHGCAGADQALNIPIQHTPNLVLEPGPHDVGFTELVGDIQHGLAVLGAGVRTDYQQRTGTGTGVVREIVNGQLGMVVANLGFLFNTIRLWKSVMAVGGFKSALQYVSADRKGQPVQSAPYSVRAVPAKLRNVDFIDLKRKA